MLEKQLKIENKFIQLHKTICRPKWGQDTVIINNPFLYVELFIKRDKNLNDDKKKQALALWNQAKEFYNITPKLSNLSSPLMSYYCFLNAAKTLLVCNGIQFSEQHGISGRDDKDAHLANITIKIHENGVLPALIKYFGEKEKKKEYSIRDMLYNLAYIHRAYKLSYRGTTELFVPIKSSKYILKDDEHGKEAWLGLELNKRYNSQKFIKTLPIGFSVKNKDNNRQEPLIIRTKDRINFKKFSKDIEINKIYAKHRKYRLSTFYIA